MNKKPDIRFLNDMKDVLYDQKWLKTSANFEIYYMYRGIKKENDIRYDITVMPCKMLGKEFPKTKGHKHKKGYQELIQVTEGNAIYLFQKMENKNNQIVKDCYAIKAKKHDFLIIPPDYYHTTINPSKKELKMANWIFDKCESDYKLFEKMNGACYYYLKSGWVKNKNYKKIPELRFEKPLKLKPTNLNFLLKP